MNSKEYMHIYIGDQWYKMEYWRDGPWYVGRLTDKPSVRSQGGTVGQLESNIRDEFAMIMEP